MSRASDRSRTSSYLEHGEVADRRRSHAFRTAARGAGERHSYRCRPFSSAAHPQLFRAAMAPPPAVRHNGAEISLRCRTAAWARLSPPPRLLTAPRILFTSCPCTLCLHSATHTFAAFTYALRRKCRITGLAPRARFTCASQNFAVPSMAANARPLARQRHSLRQATANAARAHSATRALTTIGQHTARRALSHKRLSTRRST